MEELLPENGPGGAKDRRPDGADGPYGGSGRADDGAGRADDRMEESAGRGDARLGWADDGALVRVSIAGPDQAELIADLARRTFYDSFSAQNTAENIRIFQDEQFTREMQIAEVGAPGRTFFLASIDGEPVGFASMRENPPPRALGAVSAIEIVQLYSEQKTIGKGVGKALMAACLEFARQKGKEWVWLGVWEHNPRAIAFYQKWGFERFGEHIFLVGLDAQTDWWMKKKLT